jgi:hypothetical protein
LRVVAQRATSIPKNFRDEPKKKGGVHYGNQEEGQEGGQEDHQEEGNQEEEIVSSS